MRFTRYLLTLLVLCFFSFSLKAQVITNAPEQNCIGGIPVCQYSYSQATAYSGFGTIDELNTSNEDCLGSAEDNGVWYIITVTAPGSLAFLITPNDPNDDYDFAMWDITGQGCSLIYNYATHTPNPYEPVRCDYSGQTNYNGVTGLTDTAIFTSNNAGGSQFVSTLNVVAGQTFAINVSDFANSVNGYTINFASSTASIFDTIPPRFQSVPGACQNTDSIIVTMSQPLQCNSLDANGSNLYITPAVDNIISAFSTQCAAGGTSASNYVVKFANPLPFGNYELHAKIGGDGNTVISACGYSEPISDSIAFSVFTNVTVDAGIDTTTCINNPLQLNATLTSAPSPGVTYTYVWTPDTYINNDSIQNPIVMPPADIYYTVTVLQNGSAQCSIPDSVHVAVLQGYTLLNHDTAICKGSAIQLTIIGDSRYTYTWTPPTGLSNPSIADPVASPIINTTYTVSASFPGCVDSVTSITINVLPDLFVNAGIDTTTCINFPLHLNANVVSPVAGVTYTYLWSPDTNINNDTLQSPTVMPPSDMYYSVIAIQNGSSLCSVPDSVHITVLQGYTLLNHDTAICIGSSVQLNVLGDPRYTYTWTPGGSLNDSTITNPIATPDTTTVYRISAYFPGCVDSVTAIKIDVQPIPIITISDLAKCEPDTLLFTAYVAPSYAHYTYLWTPGGSLNDSTVLDPVFFGDTSTFFHLLITTPAGCNDSDSAFVTVYPGNFSHLLNNDTGICPRDSVHLVDTGGTVFNWVPTIGLSDSAIGNPVASPTNTTFYTVYIKDIHGCLDTQHINIVVFPAALLDLGDSVTLYPGESYQISPQTNCLNFSWFPPLGLTATNISNPIASPDVNTKYIVNASTENGCTIVDSLNVNVDPNTLLALPNAFTPGNGPNNELKIIKRGIATLHYFRVFNRWGQQVFETTNIDDGWDGTFKGTPQPFSVYVYEVEAETSNGRRFYKQGNVTLLR